MLRQFVGHPPTLRGDPHRRVTDGTGAGGDSGGGGSTISAAGPAIVGGGAVVDTSGGSDVLVDVVVVVDVDVDVVGRSPDFVDADDSASEPEQPAAATETTKSASM